MGVVFRVWFVVSLVVGGTVLVLLWQVSRFPIPV